jgi:hypothetical protein
VTSLDDVEQYPWWSGMFNEFDGEGTALMLIHDADDRYHQPPRGWRLASIQREKPVLCSDNGACIPGAQCVLGAVEVFWWERA